MRSEAGLFQACLCSGLDVPSTSLGQEMWLDTRTPALRAHLTTPDVFLRTEAAKLWVTPTRLVPSTSTIWSFTLILANQSSVNLFGRSLDDDERARRGTNEAAYCFRLSRLHRRGSRLLHNRRTKEDTRDVPGATAPGPPRRQKSSVCRLEAVVSAR